MTPKPQRADLRHADLSGADLSGSDLRGAWLNLVDLAGADLTGADLSGAWLVGGDLTAADLRRAKVTEANLIYPNLSGADLGGANLRGVCQDREDTLTFLAGLPPVKCPSFFLDNTPSWIRAISPRCCEKDPTSGTRSNQGVGGRTWGRSVSGLSLNRTMVSSAPQNEQGPAQGSSLLPSSYCS